MHVHYTESVVISSESQLKNSVSSNYYTEEFIFHIHVAREARSYGAHLWPMYHSRSFSKDFSYVKMQLHDPVLDLYLSWSEDNVRKVNFCIHLLISSQCDRWYRKDVKVIIDSRQIRQLKAWTACIDKMKNVRDRPDIKHLVPTPITTVRSRCRSWEEHGLFAILCAVNILCIGLGVKGLWAGFVDK